MLLLFGELICGFDTRFLLLLSSVVLLLSSEIYGLDLRVIACITYQATLDVGKAAQEIVSKLCVLGIFFSIPLHPPA